MAQILDKQGLQHYANKMCNADNRKVGSKSLPTTLNEIDTAIDGFKTLFESEYGTPVNMELENNKNAFSIGTGTNIDKKDDIENSFTDIELSGNTVINLIQEKSYLDWHVWYCGRKSSEGIFIGRGSKYSSQASPNVTTSTDVRCKIVSKNNSSYTLIFDATVLEGTSSEFTIEYNGICIRNTAKIKNGRNVLLIQSDESQNGTFQIYSVSGNNNEEDINIRLTNIIILEGDWTNKPIPQYFEGMKSVGEKEDGNHKIEILSNNSNLISETQKEWENKDNPRSEFLKTIDLSPIIDKYGLIEYTLTFDIKATKEGQCRVYAQNGSDSKYSIGYNDIKVTTDYVRHKIKFTPTLIDPKVTMTSLAFYSTYGSGVFTTIKNIKLQIGETSSDFVPHKFDKKEILLNEPLRGLSNEVRDTIEKINGEWKIVRRCGESILNGSENWILWSRYGSEIRDDRDVSGFGVKLPLAVSTTSTKVICDNFATGGTVYNPDDDSKTNHTYYTKSKELIYCYYANAGATQMLGISIKNSKLGLNSSNWNTTVALANFKNWLSQNLTKVIYQLDTPIIEDISPITLQCWKNGTISIDEVLPVESTHTVALNKSAQIQKNIEELTVLRNRVKALEKQYDNSTLNQAYELELLRLDMELDNII